MFPSVKKWFTVSILCLIIADPSFANSFSVSDSLKNEPLVVHHQSKKKLPDLLQYVSTLQGTDSKFSFSNGNLYPAVALPNGMNFWSPQTGENGNGWKYQYQAKTIRGFGEAHQCSPWANDFGVFSLMPVTGKLTVAGDKRATEFSHDNEIAKPNYYKVRLANGVTTELSPTERGAHFKFSYPQSQKAYLVLDGYTEMSGIKIYPKKHKITGYVTNGRAVPDNFKNYFVITFDQPFVSYGTWENQQNTTSAGIDSSSGRGVGAYVQFQKGTQVQAKVASSYISTEQAALTLHRELGKFNTVEETRKAAANIWNQTLNKIRVSGGSRDDMETFYSSFYRASLFPIKFYEIDKNGNPRYYSPNDGKVYDGYLYTNEGFWDTFRSQFPLNNIIRPTMEGRFIKSLLSIYDHRGWLPEWPNPGADGGGMIGNHVMSLFADAWVKGIHSFNPDSALKAYFHEATNSRGKFGRPDWQDYFTLGYVPYPQNSTKTLKSTARTLAYAYDDFCAYKLAKMTGNAFYERIFARQMYNYKNVFDSKVNFMRGRDADGNWDEPFNPNEWGGAFVEGASWQWTWAVFHDVQGLVNLMGGKEAFTAKLDSVFTVSDSVAVGTYGQMIHEMSEMKAAQMGEYDQGNQPSFHIPYLFNYVGQPWKTQKYVRTAMKKLYSAAPDGFPGDEDEGSTSSWYVMSALGFYSVTPGTNQYVLGSPVFKKAVITMENGKQFVIKAKNNSDSNVYIQNAMLNGQNYTHNWITYEDIVDGGSLEFTMGPKPNFNRGTKEKDMPFSLSKN